MMATPLALATPTLIGAPLAVSSPNRVVGEQRQVRLPGAMIDHAQDAVVGVDVRRRTAGRDRGRDRMRRRTRCSRCRSAG